MATHIVLLSTGLFVLASIVSFNSADAANFQESCNKGSECTSTLGDGALCANTKKCLCQADFIYSVTTKKCVYKIGMLGDACQGDTQICYLAADSTQHVGCVQGTCQCQSPYVPSLDKTKCVLGKKEGDTCTLSSECTASMGDGGQCLNNVCSCQDGFLYLRDVCAYKVVIPGDSCTNQYQTCDKDADGKQLSCESGKCQRSTAAVATLSFTVLAVTVVMGFI